MEEYFLFFSSTLFLTKEEADMQSAANREEYEIIRGIYGLEQRLKKQYLKKTVVLYIFSVLLGALIFGPSIAVIFGLDVGDIGRLLIGTVFYALVLPGIYIVTSIVNVELLRGYKLSVLFTLLLPFLFGILLVIIPVIMGIEVKGSLVLSMLSGCYFLLVGVQCLHKQKVVNDIQSMKDEVARMYVRKRWDINPSDSEPDPDPPPFSVIRGGKDTAE